MAGNERGVNTSRSYRHTRMEDAEINKSLPSLKECIRALGCKGAPSPLYGSKLTRAVRVTKLEPNSLSAGNSEAHLLPSSARDGAGVREATEANGAFVDTTSDTVSHGAAATRDPSVVSATPGLCNKSWVRLSTLGNQTARNGLLEVDDLAMLRSTNDGEITNELFTFQEVVA
ncbi:Kinesin protein [Fasciola gigantica]|uniref:Kinesin protein n=1 Tax=Fasciola gigantica TaxID=46835 RepID=A0A504Y7C7_FASGI|nr:Kinesin protein [Fasciola gigantica]